MDRRTFLLATAAAGADTNARNAKRVRIHFWAGERAVDRANIHVKLSGEEARVERVFSPEDDLILLVVTDLATDLAEADAARGALIASFEKLQPRTWISLLKAQDDLRVLTDPSPHRDAAITSLRQLAVVGRAGLLTSVEQVEELGDRMLAKARIRTAALFITDSSIANYREDFTNPVVNSSDSRDMSRRFPEGLVRERISRLSRKLSVASTPLFIVHLNYRSDKLNEAYQTGLGELAAVTGGEAIVCRTLAEIPEAVTSTIRKAEQHWAAVVTAPASAPREGLVELTLGGEPVPHRTRYDVSR